uniref:RRM domain-containing protein n=1 Tax=Lotus japonicus TaxID=34305 RepID=I3T4E2_LOTJA|nr:unknown [Lotus japonicus]
MSITTMPAFKFLTVAESCLLSQPSLFSSKTRYPILSNSLKTLKLQLPCSNSSPFSPSLLSTTHRSPLLTFVAQTSDWAQQEEEGGAAWENEGEPTWANEDSDETEGGEEVVASAEPSEDLKIFVGNLPWDVESENLAMLFEEAGSVEFAEVIYNKATNQSRGFGFVIMSTAEDLEKALNKFSGYELDGRVLTVNKATPKEARPERPPRTFGSGSGSRDSGLSVYVGNLPWSVDAARLEEIFREHGNVENARIVMDRETGRSRGFGFVTMSSEADINGAIAALDGQSLDGRTIRVSVAEGRSGGRSSF